MDLHYSQTDVHIDSIQIGFTTLWIYTILKRQRRLVGNPARFTTLWIYTILKHAYRAEEALVGFTTLWIYTILKPICINY